MEISGSKIHDTSFRFRMYVFVLAGLCAFGALLQWRGQTLLVAELQDQTIGEGVKIRPRKAQASNTNRAKLIQDAINEGKVIK